MPRGRGGKRTPANPAPVSGPGALSERTDGGPGSDTQPLRSHDAQFHGQRQALAAQQRAAPLAARQGGDGPAAAAGQPGGGRTHPVAGRLFDATDNPNEPITAGAALGPGPGPASQGSPATDLLLAAYRIAPSEPLRRMIERSGRRG